MSALLKTALKLIERGFSPVPVPHKTKGPVIADWQRLRLTTETAAEHFNGRPGNIGIILGEASGNLIDLDLDDTTAIKAASYLLPATEWITGRSSAPRSHYWYRSPLGLPAKTVVEFTDPVNKTGPHKGKLLELRTGNHQTLFLPSVHPSGEKIEKYGDLNADPANVEASVLIRAANRTAAAALLARHWPGGSFHNASLALAGTLKRAGWSQDDATRFVEAVAVAADSQDVKDRLKGVEDTYGKDAPITGAPELRKLIDPRVVDAALNWLGIKASKQVKVRHLPPYRPFPVEVLPEPIKTFTVQASETLRVDPSFIALPVLAAVAAAIGNTRGIRLRRKWVEPSILWTAIIGDSGELKTPSLRMALDPLHQAQGKEIEKYRAALDEYEAELDAWERTKKQRKDSDPGPRPEPPKLRRIISSDATIERLAQSLEENPRGILLGRDELGAWLGSFRRYKGKSGGSDHQNYLEMYNAGTINIERKTGPRPIVYVRRAAVSITGGIQPGALARSMADGEYLECGLAARLIMAMPPKRPKEWTEADLDEQVEDAYVDLLCKLYSLSFAVLRGDEVPHLVDLDADAKAHWKRFYNAFAREQAAAEGEIAAALSKLEGAAARLALIYHVVSHAYVDADDRRPIGTKAVEAGIAIAKWAADEARRIYGTFGETEQDRDTRRLVEFIRLRGGRITVRDLQRSNSRKYPDGDSAKAALDRLVDAEVGTWVESEGRATGGHRLVWFSLNPCPTHDTSDTCSDDDDFDGDTPTEQAPDTRPPTPGFSSEKRASVGSVMRRTDDNPTSQPPPDADTVGGMEKQVSCATHTLITRQADLTMALSAIEETALVGLDLETTGLNPRTAKARLLSLATDTVDGGSHVYVVDLDAIDPTPLWPALAATTIVGHNLAFDLAFLARLDFAPGKVIDTMLVSQVLHAGERQHKHGLDVCCRRELGIEIDKALQTSNWAGELTPAQIEYAAADADLARRLYAALKPKIEAAKLTATVELENRAVLTVAAMGQAGVGFDRQAWLKLADDAEVEQAQIKADLDAAAPAKPQGEMFGPSWNWDSPVEVKAAFKAAGIEIEKTDDDTLATIDHPLAGLLRRYRSATKRTGTYGRDWLKHVDADDRVYASWRQIGADSGRMACSTPNLQNLPRDVRYRRCFKAPAGRLLIKADYSQIELRLAAAIAGESTMIEAYRRGDDLHTLTAKTILGKAKVSKDDRQLAKSLNFGLIYGMGATALRVYCRANYGVNLTLDQAKAYRAEFFRAYPGLAKWHQKAGFIPANGPAITTRTIGGRHRQNVSRFTEKLNTPVQGAGADGLKAALALLWEHRAHHPTASIVLAVHDEIVVEADETEVDAVANWLKGCMVEGMQPFANPVPVEVEATIAHTWGG